MFSTLADITSYIQRHRSQGVVHVHVAHRDEDRASMFQIADRFISERGFKTRADCWEPISRSDACRIWTHVLNRDLAYQTELIPRETAEELARDFIALFDAETAVYLTNCRLPELGKSGFSWRPITDATFDAGAIVIDAQEIGMIWVEDED